MKGFSSTVNNQLLNRVNLALVFVLCLGFCLRFFWVMTLDNSISWEDEADYMALSQKIIAGEGYVNENGTPTAFRAVGYPVFLSLLGLTGVSDAAGVRLFQVYISTLIIWLVYILGLRIFDKKTGITAAFITAVYPYYIFMPGTILAATLLTALVLSATLALHKAITENRPALLAAGGFMLGLSVLTKPSAMTFVFAVIAWLVFVVGKNSRNRLKYTLLFTATILLTITPWMLRNYVKMDTMSLTTNAGRNLWLGNNPLTTVNSGSNIKMESELERRIDNAGSEVGAEKIYYFEAKSFILRRPGQFILLTAQKGLHLWRWTPSPTTDSYGQQNNYLFWLSVLSVGPVFLLALAGFFLVTPETRKHLLLWIFYILFFTIVHAFFISKVRFRLPLDAFMVLSAACTLHMLIRIIHKRKVELIFNTDTGFAFSRMGRFLSSSRKAKE